MELGYRGSSVVVTGGAANIGSAIVLAFAREGALITIVDLDEVQARNVSEQAHTLGAQDVLVIKADVTDFASVKVAVDATQSRFGKIDVFVNNAGWDKISFFTDTQPEIWERIVGINYLGVVNSTAAVLPGMISRNRGAIISISSDASRQGEAREAVYAGAKAGVNAFMKSIARENGRFGIRCNVVCPGLTVPGKDDAIGSNSMWASDTPMFTEQQLEKAAASMPLRKVGRPRDIANAVLFLASDEVAGHITGQVLSVSGGYSMVG
ncbi:MAG TPA: SDR family oxidoreductase [Rhizomicrobium sp.]|nr:SDR family oxidoreductase [Rhizomicrobium sp.]